MIGLVFATEDFPSDIFPQHTSTGVSASSSKMLGGDISGSAASDFKALGSMFVDRDSAMDIVPSSSRHGSDYGPSMISSTSEHSKAVVDAVDKAGTRPWLSSTHGTCMYDDPLGAMATRATR